MGYKQSSSILIMLLLAIIATTCLASFDLNSRKSFNRRSSFKSLARKSMFHTRTADCPSPYLPFGHNGCMCSYVINLDMSEPEVIRGEPADNYNSLYEEGNCGEECPDGLRFLPGNYVDGPFTFAFGDNNVVQAGRVCKP